MFVQATEESSTHGASRRDARLASPSGVQALPLERLEHEIETLAAHINAGSCRWLELVAEFDRRDGWADTGCRTCAEWISWRCAIAPRAAREHVRVARCLGELPRITEAFRSGQLSYSKVRALSRVADARCEEDLLHFAHYATAAQLERIVRGYRRVTREEANRAHERAFLAWHWDEDGSLCLNGRLPAEDGALLLRALEQAWDALSEQAPERAERESENGSAEPAGQADRGGSAEPPPPRPPPRPTHAEALAAMTEGALAAGPTPASGGERYQVVIHADADALVHDHAAGRCQLDDGPSVAGATARRLACDSSIVKIVERDGVLMPPPPPAASRGWIFDRAHSLRRDRVPPRPGLADPERPVPSSLPSPGKLATLNRKSALEIDRDTCLVGDEERMNLGWSVEAMYDAVHSRSP